MALSADTGWCVANMLAARSYLSTGNFYIYFENNGGEDVDGVKVGSTPVGIAAIRMNEDIVEEVRGTDRNQKINEKYKDIVISFLREENLKGGEKFVNDLQIDDVIKNIKNKLKSNEVITQNDVKPFSDHIHELGYTTAKFNVDSKNRWRVTFSPMYIDEYTNEMDLPKLKHYVEYYYGNKHFEFDLAFKEEDLTRLLDKLVCTDKNLFSKLVKYISEVNNEKINNDADDLSSIIFHNYKENNINAPIFKIFESAAHWAAESGAYNAMTKDMDRVLDQPFLQRNENDKDTIQFDFSLGTFIGMYQNYKEKIEDGDYFYNIVREEFVDYLEDMNDDFGDSDSITTDYKYYKSAVEYIIENLNEFFKDNNE
jgi:hypothetical protein